MMIFEIAFSQDKPTLFFEPEIELAYKVSSFYSQSYSIENRNFIYQNSKFEYIVKHLEFAHSSSFSIKENQNISIGIQYRFEENFIETEENEFRLIQSYNWQSNPSKLDINQSLRSEQRFYNSTTKYRLRYEFGLKLFKGKLTHANSYLRMETESLFEISKTQKPELEQRLTSIYGLEFNKETSFEIGLQYRLANYTQNLGHEIFLITGLNLQL